MTSRIVLAVVLLSLVMTVQGCQNGSENRTEPVAQSDDVATRNPTIQHCEESGYKVKPVVEDGLTRSHVCLNESSGKKCDSWAFYRGECSLDD